MGGDIFKELGIQIDLFEKEAARAAVICATAMRENGTYPGIYLASQARRAQHGSADLFLMGIVSIMPSLSQDFSSLFTTTDDQKNFSRNSNTAVLREHAKDVHGMKTLKLLSMSNDVALCFEVGRGRSIWQSFAHGASYVYRHEQVLSY